MAACNFDQLGPRPVRPADDLLYVAVCHVVHRMLATQNTTMMALAELRLIFLETLQLAVIHHDAVLENSDPIVTQEGTEV